MKSFRTALSLLTSDERKSLAWLLPLICLRGFSDMLGVALVFPFLTLIGNPDLIQTNEYLAWANDLGGFENPDEFILFAGLVFVSTIVATSALKIAVAYTVQLWLGERVHSIACRLLATYLRQPYEFTLSRHSSELVTNMLSEVSRVVAEVFKPLTEVVVSFVTLTFMVGLLMLVDPITTALAIGVFGGIYAILFMTSRRYASRIGTVLVEANRVRFRVASEALSGGKQIRLLNREASLIKAFIRPSLRFVRASAKSQILRQTPRYVVEAIAIGGTVALLLSLLHQRGSVGNEAIISALPLMGLFLLAGYRMLPAFQKGYFSIIALRMGSAALELLHEDLSELPGLPELPPSRVEPLRFGESIELRNVTYQYPGSDTPSLKNVNLRIDCGSSIGIVGQTGAGKTTLMDLLLGLIEPTSGEFLIDGNRLDHTQIRAWRANVGYVPQDIFLSDATIEQNIAFGVPVAQIDQTAVSAAARMAQIDRFIENDLPDGYDTLVGERGVRLSGGQKQRISIARALYTEPGVIAFDEATSALDNNTESRVMDEIVKVSCTRTIVMVAHRLTTVRDCDAIIMLSNGEVEKVTTYHELISSHSKVAPISVSGV